jgi:RNA polymerase sigma-70 factor, ECF subfamily
MDQARAEGTQLPATHDAEATREFDRSFRMHAARVRSLCRYLLGSQEQAEDAVSEVYVKARQAQASYDPYQSYAAWVMSVTRHHCFDLLRRRRVEGRLFAPGEVDADARPGAKDLGDSPLAHLLERESRQALRLAIEGLPQRYRLPIVLRYFEDLSYDEIAHDLSLTRQDVATLLFRAKHKLRAALGARRAREGA